MTPEAWNNRFEAWVLERTGGDPAWLHRLRAEALDLFAAQGIPTTRLEEWRYTNLSALEHLEFEDRPASGSDILFDEAFSTAKTVPLDSADRWVFVDGHLNPGLSSSSASKVFESLAALRERESGDLRNRLGKLAQPKRHAFAALNTAFLDDGAVIRLAEGTQQERPIHLVFLTTPDAIQAHHPRILIELGPGSRAQIIQEHRSIGNQPTLTNVVSEIHAGEESSLDLILLQNESDAAFHISNTSASIERNARIHLHTVTLGGRLVRNDLQARINSEGGECRLSGLFFADSDCLVDNHTEIDHAVPHGTSQQLYKGILNQNSKGIFRGRVVVAPAAQKTDARQHNPNLLLGNGAEMDSRPQLEIRADDVKCSHGTSIGRLDEEALFYLRSRGIDLHQARVLLTEGFASEILAALPVEGLATKLTAELRERLAPSMGFA